MDAYRLAWVTVNARLREGQSLSGSERNCSFLNLGGGRMADVSGVTGLDWKDDARGLAAVDWDGDGDLDLWLTNRTGPTVRYMRNDQQAGHRFLALRLQGTTCNRDAIGARVEVHLEGLGKPLLRTLHAGDAFLSQSSKELVIGLGRARVIERVVVRWPGGAPEEFDGCEPDGRYRIVQGEGRAERLQPRTGGREFVTSVPATPAEGAIRVPVFSRMPVARMTLSAMDPSLQPLELGAPRTGPTLVNLWASWCAPCVKELKEFAARESDLRGNGLEVVALCVDRLGDPEGGKEAEQLMAGMKFPFSSGWMTEDAMQSLEALQQVVIDAKSALPVPSSFLLDGRGEVAFIYKGPVSVEQLGRDLEILESVRSREDWFEAALPLPGKWREPPRPVNPIQVALRLFESGDQGLARGYLAQLIALAEASPPRPDLDAAELHYFLATLLEEAGQVREAAQAYRAVLRHRPGYREAHRNLGRQLLAAGNHAEAAEHLAEAVSLGERTARIHDELARCYYLLGEYARAADQLRANLALDPRNLAGANNLAWLLATNRLDAVRDGEEAVRRALGPVEASGRRNPRALDTLAAAYAESGDFQRAIATASEALELVGESDAGLQAKLRARLESYRAGKPWRE